MKEAEYLNELTEGIDKLNEHMSKIDKKQKKCVSASQNKSDNFIYTKQLKQQIKSESKVLGSLSSVTKSLGLIETCNMSKLFDAIDTFKFGYISGNGEIESVVEDAEYNIHSVADTTISCASDSCLMEDGNIILTDQSNRNLKRLDHSFQLKETLVLPGKPCAVCPTGHSEVAVSLHGRKEIQFVSISTPMTTTTSFKVGEPCRGLAYCNGKLYLSCGGMAEYHDGLGQIRICDRTGNIIHRIDRDVSTPKRMSIHLDKSPVDIFVADEENGVLVMETSETCVDARNIFKHRGMVSPLGICYAGRGQVIVCGYVSNNVMIISESGTLIKELLTKSQGIVMPKTVCLDKTGSKLLVGMADTNHIKMALLIRK